uniref:Uncharacterized protein n=1 Tax=Anguilla anguilla TaxID=7936 RepID=A0A0E9R3U1_ANGAN
MTHSKLGEKLEPKSFLKTGETQRQNFQTVRLVSTCTSQIIWKNTRHQLQPSLNIGVKPVGNRTAI